MDRNYELKRELSRLKTDVVMLRAVSDNRINRIMKRLERIENQINNQQKK